VKLRVILEPREGGGYNVGVPAFPSIQTFGSTKEEALHAARDAIARAIDFDVEVQTEVRAQPKAAVQVHVNKGTVYCGDEQVQPRGIALALLIALAVEPRDVSIETLCERLYPQAPLDQGYNALKMTVYRARQQLGQNVIQTTERGYRLADDVIVDIRFLPQIVRAIRSRSIPKALESRLPSIFAELIIGRPAVFQTWDWFAPTERTLLRATREVGLYIGERALSAGKPLAALDVARPLIMRDLLDEAAYELAIRAHLAMGNRASALLEYRAYAGRLQDHMGIEPPLAMRRLVEVMQD
jgi:DNA-binding SARP family transcriptional activator/predicted RNase H-like HicB family nuclease